MAGKDNKKGKQKAGGSSSSAQTAKGRKTKASIAAQKKLDEEVAQKLLDAEVGNADDENSSQESMNKEDEAGGKDAELVGVLAQAQKPAVFAIDAVVRFAAIKKAKTGPGAPPKSSASKRYTLDVNGTDSFASFKDHVITALKPLTTKYSLASLSYNDLDLEAKVPKGHPLWSKKPLAIDSEERFKDFKESLFKPGCYYGESKLCIQEPETDTSSDEDEEFSEDDDESDVAHSTRKRKKSQPVKGDSLEKKKRATLQKVQQRWKCRRNGCNLDGHCLDDEFGKHHPLSSRALGRFVEAIVVAGTATIDEPPAFLFDREDAMRGRSGPRRSSEFSPVKPHKDKAPSTSTASAHASDLPSGSRSASFSKRKLLNKGLSTPLKEGPMLCSIAEIAAHLRIGQNTVKALHKAEYFRVSQLASAYSNNFEALSDELNMTASMLSNVEDLLKQWPEMDGNSRPSNQSHFDTGGFVFGPGSNDDDDIFGPANFQKSTVTVKQEASGSDLTPSAHRTPIRRPLAQLSQPSPIRMVAEDAIVVSSTQCSQTSA
ncbi:hypothetical protein CF335_g7979 [Tilletia laevis]|nr:hypothetical protein CF335_g7979 [Tilletia laevis]